MNFSSRLRFKLLHLLIVATLPLLAMQKTSDDTYADLNKPGPEAMAYWEKAKQDWIDRHSKVHRIKGDPGYSEKGASSNAKPEY